MTNKDFFYKQKAHVTNVVKPECECKDIIDRMNDEIKHLNVCLNKLLNYHKKNQNKKR
jgi:hypothetical protein